MRVAAVVLGFIVPLATAAPQTPIYRCTDAGVTVFSDRPCAQSAEAHEIDDSRVTVYTPVPPVARAVVKTAVEPSRAKRAKSVRLPDPARHAASCAKLEERLRDVRTKMRTGYGAKEGERLKERQRQLERRRRQEKCR